MTMMSRRRRGKEGEGDKIIKYRQGRWILYPQGQQGRRRRKRWWW
jgi:hypothetical protein